MELIPFGNKLFILRAQRWYLSCVNRMQHWYFVVKNMSSLLIFCIVLSCFVLFCSVFFSHIWSHVLECTQPTTALFWCDESHIITKMMNWKKKMTSHFSTLYLMGTTLWFLHNNVLWLSFLILYFYLGEYLVKVFNFLSLKNAEMSQHHGK